MEANDSYKLSIVPMQDKSGNSLNECVIIRRRLVSSLTVADFDVQKGSQIMKSHAVLPGSFLLSFSSLAAWASVPRTPTGGSMNIILVLNAGLRFLVLCNQFDSTYRMVIAPWKADCGPMNMLPVFATGVSRSLCGSVFLAVADGIGVVCIWE